MEIYDCDYIKESEKDEWDELVAKNPHAGFQQTFAWANFLENTGWKSFKIGLFNQKRQLRAGTLIYKFFYKGGYNFLHIPEGPVLNYENNELAKKQWRLLQPFIYSFIDLNKHFRTTHLRMEARMEFKPEWLIENFQKAPWTLSPRSTQIIDLKKDLSLILKEMKAKTRYNINLAEKKDLTVVKFERTNRKALKQFFTLYKKTAEKKGFIAKKINSFKDLLKKYQQSYIYLAYKDNFPLAGAIMIYCGERSTYLFGGSDYNHRILMAPYLLHWKIIEDAKLNGYTEYDFWGISKNAEDYEDEWHGITKFKKGFGGQQLNFLTSLDLVFQEKFYQEFIAKFETNP